MIGIHEKKQVRSGFAECSEAVDIAAFSEYLYRQRKLVLATCLLALGITGIASFLMPPKYTAKASILIEPPAGNDPRGATAVSPVYLESLKTYEHFADSDSLFRQALKQLGLRELYSKVAIESLKGRVLKVRKPKDEKILEISATLGDPLKAQQFAHYIAQQTVATNRSLETASTRDLSDDAEALVQAAQSRLLDARTARDSFLKQQPIVALETELNSLSDLKTRVDRNVADADVELAALTARFASQHADASSGIGSVTGSDVAAIRAQASTLRKQSEALDGQLTTYGALLEKRKHDREILDKELQTAQAQYEAALLRKTEILSSAAFRGERLEIIDPGVVPDRPTSPNIPLNLVVALLGSVSCCVLYLAFRFGYLHMQSAFR